MHEKDRKHKNQQISTGLFQQMTILPATVSPEQPSGIMTTALQKSLDYIGKQFSNKN